MTQSNIRPLRRGDLDRVAHLVGVNEMFPPEMLKGMAGPFLAGETGEHRWVVSEGESIDGVAYYVPEQLTEGTWNVLMIAVDPEVHGRGIGSQLMRHIEDELSRDGVRILLVETSGLPEFKRTRGFYDMLGYDREARIREFYAAGDDKVIFRKALKV
ncbi:GNAT family N-acetyltransferase [Erythrobacter sp. THAF29]|uniref:GNAT family N-acetyltransferase n=1 Tax=Erythrobacter sp. THAF29 TaxID=2587851 RepID=UPI001269449B|nr:GNAT family N-acetyltransferase [Erythrobacter sp. THAF29]QFT78419.1 putative acetyltransferase [Erythrobacter sp. THAF29]